MTKSLSLKALAATAASFAIALCVTGPVAAETTDQELKVAFKAASLCKDVPSGTVPVAIVYAPGNASSAADLAAIEAIMGSGLEVKGNTYQPVAVAAGDVSGGLAGKKLIIVTEGVGDDVRAKVLEAAKANKALSLSTDMSCVEAGHCVLGVDVGSGVTISLSGEVSREIGLTFDAAFEFMVKEI